MRALTASDYKEFLTCEDKVRSPLRYPGGKQKAIKLIRRLLPSKCMEYREPMVGGGSVFLYAKRAQIARKYWINDQFEELISFWKIAQDPQNCARMQEELRNLHSSFSSPDEIEKYFRNARMEENINEYRTALLFFFFNRVTFSGTTKAGGFSKAASTTRFTVSSIDRLGFLPKVVNNVRITNYDFEPVIEESGKDVFIFLDPPYYTASKLYGRNGSLHNFDHVRLKNSLRQTKHRFLITYDDCSEVRDLYSSWANVMPWQLQYGMNNCSKDGLSKIGSELFISNYELPKIS